MNEPIVFLPLTQGQVAIIDFTDFEKVGHFKWFAMKTKSGNFYAARKGRNAGGQKTCYLHHEILGIKGVDHRDGNGLDCRRENLRPATNQQNHQAFRRKSPGTSSQFRGVAWCNRDSRWQAQIETKGISFYLGRFRNEKEAACAFDKMATELGFAKEALNFP